MIPEKTIQEETIYEGAIFDLIHRQAELVDGQIVHRDIVVHRGAVVIIPMTKDQEVRLIKQFRAAAGKWIIELPAGGMEAGEDPDLTAPRELLEETGDQAETWQKLGGFYSSPGIMNEYLHLYLAMGLTSGANDLEFDEHIEVLTVPWAEVMTMIKQGEIEDAKTIAGLMAAGLHLGLLA